MPASGDADQHTTAGLRLGGAQQQGGELPAPGGVGGVEQRPVEEFDEFPGPLLDQPQGLQRLADPPGEHGRADPLAADVPEGEQRAGGGGEDLVEVAADPQGVPGGPVTAGEGDPRHPGQPGRQQAVLEHPGQVRLLTVEVGGGDRRPGAGGELLARSVSRWSKPARSARRTRSNAPTGPPALGIGATSTTPGRPKAVGSTVASAAGSVSSQGAPVVPSASASTSRGTAPVSSAPPGTSTGSGSPSAYRSQLGGSPPGCGGGARPARRPPGRAPAG